jgi:uncharacterized membrane protein YdfJ with MMPL/SSD domain
VTRRWVDLIDRRPWWIVMAWVVGAVWITLAAPSVRSLGTADQTSFVPASAPSGRADALLREAFPDDPTRDPAVIVFSRAGGITAADRAYMTTLTATLRSHPEYVKSVQTATASPELAPVLRSADAEAELLIVSLRAQVFSVSSENAIRFLRERTADAPRGLDHHVTGLAALTADQATATIQAFDRTAVATVLLVLFILVLVYRSPVAPLISLVSIGGSFLVARGLAGYLAAAGLKIASLSETFIIVMAFGAGTDYVMFVVSRLRESRASQRDHRAALRGATRAVAPTILASGATVTLGMMAFLAAGLGLFRSFGPVLGLSIAVTVVASLTLTPALLRLVGPAAFWPCRGVVDATSKGAVRWARVADLVRARPMAILVISVVGLALPASAATGIRQSFDMPAELPKSSDSRQGFQSLSLHYPPGSLAPVFVVIHDDKSLLQGGRLHAVDELTDELRRLPGVAQVRSATQPTGAPLTNVSLRDLTGGSTDLRRIGLDPNHVDVGPLLTALNSPRGLRIDSEVLNRYPQLRPKLDYFLDRSERTTRLVVAFDESPYSTRAIDRVRSLDRLVAGDLAGGPLAGAQIYVGGPSAYFADIQSLAFHDIRTVSAITLGLILLVLAVLLRSAVAPVYLMASVLLSMFAAMGITAWVFQDVLGRSGVAFWLPAILFVLLMALGSDYNIFIAGRIREEVDRGRDVPDAVRVALVSTGPTITAAGLVLAGTFGALLITPIPSVRQVGFGVCVGILIDTFVVRTLLVPAATIMLGRWAFWPSSAGLSTPRQRRLATAASSGAVLGLAGALIAFGLARANAGRDIAVVQEAGPERSAVSAAFPLVSPRPAPHGAPVGATSPPAAPQTRSADPPGATPSVPPQRTKDRTPDRKAATVPSVAAAAVPRPSVGPVVIPVPRAGEWDYHARGTRRIGEAGSPTPFDEHAVSVVSRADNEGDVKIVTRTSLGTVSESRRYRAGSIALLSAQLDATGMSFGGTFDRPQILLRLPIRVGDEWSGRWRTNNLQGTTRARVTGRRSIAVEGRAMSCYVIDRSTQLTGQISGDQQQTTCWSVELGMPISDDMQLHGVYQGIAFSGEVHLTLSSTPGQSGTLRATTPDNLSPGQSATTRSETLAIRRTHAARFVHRA